MAVDVAWEDRGVVLTLSGAVPLDVLVDHCRRIAADHRFDGLRYSIVDLRSLSPEPVSEHSVEELAAENWAAHLSNGNLRTFLIAEHPPVLSVAQRYRDVIPTALGVEKPTICSSPEQAREALVLAAPYPSGAGI